MRTIAISTELDPTPKADVLDRAVFAVGDEPLCFDLVEVDEPIVDFDDQALADYVLVKVRAFSMNYRDRALMTVPSLRPHLAAGVGSELAGEVVAAGPAAPFTAGDRVMADMAYPDAPSGAMPGVICNTASAELAVLHHGKLMAIPNGMSYETAAAFVLCAQTAASLTRRCDIVPGDRVLVTAPTSNTSRFAIEMLQHKDVSLFGITRSAGTPEELGLPASMRLLQIDGPSTLQRLVANPDFAGFDVMIDPFADVYLPWAGHLLAMGGRYITCGSAVQSGAGERDTSDTTPPLDELIGAMIVKNLQVMGNCLGTSEDLHAAVAAWERGELEVPIDSVHTDGELAQFLQRSHAADRRGKVVFTYS